MEEDSMTFDVSKLKISTKTLVALVFGIGSLLQIPQVSAPVFALAKSHPHFATVLAVLTGLLTLLHNPQVETVLGINQVSVTKDGTVTTTVTKVTLDQPVEGAACVNCGADPKTGVPESGAAKVAAGNNDAPPTK
jgi:hypothetical protein